MPPSGQFTLTPAHAKGRHIGALAAGSGITPIISILASALAAEPHTRATLLYANHDHKSVMFGPELTMLARQYEGRLRITHFHSRYMCADATVGSATAEPSYERIEAGRLTADRLAALLEPQSGGLAAVDEWYVCGPAELAMTATRTLTAHRVPVERIHRELFVAPTQIEFAKDAAVHSSTVTVTIGGATTQMVTGGDEALLEAVLRAGIDAPYSCTGGACGTCRAKLLTGAVHMEHTYALNEGDVADGWILTCQSRPTTELIHIDYGV
jgi:ferredoxin-NADP reductase